MNIAFIEPLSKGFNRMKKALFQPFDLKKWFIVGFTAFLANLLDGFHGKGGSRYEYEHVEFGDFIQFPATAWEWILANMAWVLLIVFGVLFLIALIIILTWVSSRAKFMFLDNVVHDRAEVANPWHQYKKQGNSLWLFRLVFGLGSFILVMIYVGLFLLTVFIIHDGLFPRQLPIGLLALFIITFIGVVFGIALISLLLNAFIVPIMYKQDIKIIEAIRRFKPIFTHYLPHILLYGLLTMILYILVGFCIIFFGLFTCCIGLVLLAIPYIGSVILLPVSYTFRAFSIEFLAQFGPEYSVFPEPEENSPAASTS